MKFEDTSIEEVTITFRELEEIMETVGLVRGGHWDWERVTYDYKFENQSNGDVFYLRVPGIAVQGEIEQANAKIQLKTPYLGKHYYPHGVEYDEEFPEYVVNTCKERLSLLEKLLQQPKEKVQ